MLGLLVRSQVRFFFRRKLSALTVLLGITLGVASIVAVHQIGERITLQLDASMPLHLRDVQFSLGREEDLPALSASDYFALRSAWRSGDLPGVTALAPVVQGVITLEAPEARPARSVQLVGLDWLQLLDADAQNPGFAAGPNPGNDTQRMLPGTVGAHPALVDAALGWSEGQRFAAGGLTFEVVGLLAGGSGPDALSSIYVDIGVAQQALALPPEHLSLVALRQTDPQHALRKLLENMMPGISAGLPMVQAPLLPSGWLAQGVASQMPQVSFGRSVLFNLGALGSLSLVVAWFLIYQTAVLWLRRQALVYQRLLHQGVTTAQLRLVFCCALLLVGLVAGIVGLVLGLWFASWLLAQMSQAMTPQEGQGLWVALSDVGTPVVVKALASAALVSVFAALIAFARLWQQSARATWKLLVGLALLLILLAFGFWSGSGLLGAFVAIGVTCVLFLLLLRPLLEGLRRRSLGIAGPLVWRMGVRELAWYPMDVAIALGAMVLAVATSVGVGIMVDSFRLDFNRMLGQRLAGDIQIRGNPAQVAPIVAELAQQPELYQVRRLRTSQATVSGQPVQLSLTQLDTSGAARYGLTQAVAPDAVLVNEQLARKLDLKVDSTILVQGRRVKVAGIYPGYGDTQGQLVASDDDHWDLAATRTQLQISTANPKPLVSYLQQAHPSVRIELRSSIRALALEIFDETFAITRALTYTALLVAAVGLYNALVGLSLLQERSWRLLSVMGLALRERLGFAMSRSFLIFLITAVLAIPLGIAMGWLLCQIVNPRAFGWTVPLSWSGAALWLPVAVSAMVALLAGLLSVPMQNVQGKVLGDD